MTPERNLPSRITGDQYARRIAHRLDAGQTRLPHDISERLRIARQQAVAQRLRPALEVAPASATVAQRDGTLALSREPSGWWTRLAAAVPIVALVAGLVAINAVQSEQRAHELAEVDQALLTDDLPPAAYTDPGFAQFLRADADSRR